MVPLRIASTALGEEREERLTHDRHRHRTDEISDAAETEARIDVALVTDALLGTWADIRREAREMIKDSAYWRIEGQPIPEHRERTLSQLHLLVKAGATSARANPKEYGELDNQGGNLAGFEELIVADPEPADQVGRAVGAVRVGDPPARHQAAPRPLAARRR